MGTDLKATDESAASALAGTEIVRIVQSANSARTTISAFATYFRGIVNVFTKNQSVGFVTLTDGATVNTDASLSNNFRVTLGGNRTLANPTNLTGGMVLNWQIKQDGTGSRTLAFGSKFKFGGGYSTLSTAAGAVDAISGIYDDVDDVVYCNLVIGFA